MRNTGVVLITVETHETVSIYFMIMHFTLIGGKFIRSAFLLVDFPIHGVELITAPRRHYFSSNFLSTGKNCKPVMKRSPPPFQHRSPMLFHLFYTPYVIMVCNYYFQIIPFYLYFFSYIIVYVSHLLHHCLYIWFCTQQ